MKIPSFFCSDSDLEHLINLQDKLQTHGLNELNNDKTQSKMLYVVLTRSVCRQH